MKLRVPRMDKTLRWDHITHLDGEEPPMHAHECRKVRFNVGTFCKSCELPLEPAQRRPAEPHGWVACAYCHAVVIACPLGVAAAGDDLVVDEKVELPETAGAPA